MLWWNVESGGKKWWMHQNARREFNEWDVIVLKASCWTPNSGYGVMGASGDGGGDVVVLFIAIVGK